MSERAVTTAAPNRFITKTLSCSSFALLIMLKKLLLTILIIVSNTCFAEALPNSSYGDSDIPGLADKCRARQGICPYSYIVWRKNHKDKSAFQMIYVQGN
jgi:hypothetical protein